jgi:ParB family transcriptional regulator, chromosome partitioning protein
LEDEAISMGHARALLALESKEEQLRMAHEIIEGKLSVRDIERAVKRSSPGSPSKENSTAMRNDANIRAAELKLKRFLGTQVKIQLGRHGGKIEIDFGSLSELDRIYSIIIRKSDV